ncbi:MAG TPA: tetratricopeptide repeat protein, partial [Gemmataceae bacterium]|nr:tetratricopeptide repeat protein [Gemmataceae bacterium]
MRANKEYLPCFLWRRGVWLAPLGLLLVPLLMLKGQDSGSWHASPKPVVDSPWPAGQETAPVSGWGRRPLTAPESIEPVQHPWSTGKTTGGAWPSPQGSAERSESATLALQPDESKVPAELRALLGAARAAVKRGDLMSGISRFQEYLGLNPKDHAVRREYAGVLVRAKQTTRAIEQYEMLLKALPDSSAIHFDLANVYLQIRRPQKAIEHLLAAQKGSPGDPEIETRLAQAYVGEGDLAKARTIVDQLLSRLRPGGPKVPASFGRLLLDLKRPKQALTFLVPQRLWKLDDADLLADVIRAKGWLGMRDEASRLIRELAGKQPRDV